MISTMRLVKILVYECTLHLYYCFSGFCFVLFLDISVFRILFYYYFRDRIVASIAIQYGMLCSHFNHIFMVLYVLFLYPDKNTTLDFHCFWYLSKGRLLHKGVQVTTLYGTQLKIQNRKIIKFSGRDISSLAAKGLIWVTKIYSSATCGTQVIRTIKDLNSQTVYDMKRYFNQMVSQNQPNTHTTLF